MNSECDALKLIDEFIKRSVSLNHPQYAPPDRHMMMLDGQYDFSSSPSSNVAEQAEMILARLGGRRQEVVIHQQRAKVSPGAKNHHLHNVNHYQHNQRHQYQNHSDLLFDSSFDSSSYYHQSAASSSSASYESRPVSSSGDEKPNVATLHQNNQAIANGLALFTSSSINTPPQSPPIDLDMGIKITIVSSAVYAIKS